MAGMKTGMKSRKKTNRKAKKPESNFVKLVKKTFHIMRTEGPFAVVKKIYSKLNWKYRGQELVNREMRHPRPVQKNKFVFDSYGDYGDNARVLCEYMLQQECFSDCEFVWLIDEPGRYKKTLSPRIRAVRRKMWDDRISLEAIKEVHSAQYVFYTVNVNWAKVAQKDQVFVNLWHGCSFKDNKGNRKIFFDYYLP